MPQIRLPVCLGRRVFEMRDEHLEEGSWRAHENRVASGFVQGPCHISFSPNLRGIGVAWSWSRRDITD
jgi:hypothetical protein